MRRIFLSCDPPTAFDVRASQTLCDVLALISERGSPSLDAPEWSHLYRRILVHEIFCADQLRIRTIVLQVYKIWTLNVSSLLVLLFSLLWEPNNAVTDFSELLRVLDRCVGQNDSCIFLAFLRLFLHKDYFQAMRLRIWSRVVVDQVWTPRSHIHCNAWRIWIDLSICELAHVDLVEALEVFLAASFGRGAL